MKKVFLYTATLYAFSSAHAAKVDDNLKLENLMHAYQNTEVDLKVSEALLTLYKLQEADYARNASFDKIKDSVKKLDVEALEQEYGQKNYECTFLQALLTIRNMQDQACSGNVTLEMIKEAAEQQFAFLKNIPNDESEQAAMLRHIAEIFNQALARVADATRKNTLPAVDARIFKKGVDAQSTRLKVLLIIEEFLQ